MSTRVPKTLYHYCSLPTFQKIVEGKTIWLSDISQSNDSLEMKWVYNQFLYYFIEKDTEYLERRISLYKKYDAIYDQKDKKSYIEALVSYPPKEMPKYDSKQIKDFQDKITLFQNINIYLSYVFCLTECVDSLSQWRGYADDGFGISIGFKGQYFSLFNLFKGYDIGDMFSFDKISYGVKHANEYFNQVSEFDKITENSTSDDIEEIAQQALYKISRRAAFFKNDSFKEEKEWRLAITLKNYDYSNNYFDFSSMNMKEAFQGRYFIERFGFISTNDRLVPHIELTLSLMKDAICSIYIGPKSNVSIEDMRMFLIANGLLASTNDKSIEIHYSASSYR